MNSTNTVTDSKCYKCIYYDDIMGCMFENLKCEYAERKKK